MFLEISFLLVLCLTAVFDIKYRRIPNIIAVIAFMIGLISLIKYGFPPERLIGLIFPAIILWVFSHRQKIGSGDVKLTIVVGLYYGYLAAAMILIGAIVLISCYSLFIQGRKHSSLPFAPFMFTFCLITSIIKHFLS